MKAPDEQLDRLLQAAARVPEEPLPEMPFGFESRVLAHSRAAARDAAGVTRLLRRVVVMALAVIVLAGAGAYRELNQGEEGTLTSDYAIADSAIGGAFEQ